MRLPNKRIGSVALMSLMMAGCISISTHEKMMKECRQASEGESRVRAKTLEEKTKELEEKLVQSGTEKEELEAKLNDVRTTYDDLVENLKDDLAQGDVGLNQDDGKLTITLGNQVLFRSGSAQLQAKGQKILLAVARSLHKVTDHNIQVEGHTDNQAITGALKARFPTNWDLSAARSASVVRFLQEKGGLDPAALILTAFAETRPLKENATPSGRQENRRVEITLVKKSK